MPFPRRELMAHSFTLSAKLFLHHRQIRLSEAHSSVRSNQHLIGWWQSLIDRCDATINAAVSGDGSTPVGRCASSRYLHDKQVLCLGPCKSFKSGSGSVQSTLGSKMRIPFSWQVSCEAWLLLKNSGRQHQWWAEKLYFMDRTARRCCHLKNSRLLRNCCSNYQ